MKTLRMCLLTGVVLSMACGDDDGATVVRKGEVDEGALGSGVTVNIKGNTGTIIVPFSEPIPEVDDEMFEDEMSGAVALIVSSPRSGATVDLMAGALVSGEPAAPGEFTWDVNEARDEVLMSFYNEAPGGLTLKAGREYEVQLSISTNDYVERVSPAIAFLANVN